MPGDETFIYSQKIPWSFMCSVRQKRYYIHEISIYYSWNKKKVYKKRYLDN